jgi:hypothetical protein
MSSIFWPSGVSTMTSSSSFRPIGERLVIGWYSNWPLLLRLSTAVPIPSRTTSSIWACRHSPSTRTSTSVSPGTHSSTTNRSISAGGFLSNMLMVWKSTPSWCRSFSALIWPRRFFRMATHPTRAPVVRCNSFAMSSPMHDFPDPVGDSIMTDRTAGSTSPFASRYSPRNMSRVLRTIRAWYGRGSTFVPAVVMSEIDELCMCFQNVVDGTKTVL